MYTSLINDRIYLEGILGADIGHGLAEVTRWCPAKVAASELYSNDCPDEQTLLPLNHNNPRIPPKGSYVASGLAVERVSPNPLSAMTTTRLGSKSWRPFYCSVSPQASAPPKHRVLHRHYQGAGITQAALMQCTLTSFM